MYSISHSSVTWLKNVEESFIIQTKEANQPCPSHSHLIFQPVCCPPKRILLLKTTFPVQCSTGKVLHSLHWANDHSQLSNACPSFEPLRMSFSTFYHPTPFTTFNSCQACNSNEPDAFCNVSHRLEFHLFLCLHCYNMIISKLGA